MFLSVQIKIMFKI